MSIFFLKSILNDFMYSVILTRQFSEYRAFSEQPYRQKGVFSSYPGGSNDKESATMQETQVQSLGWEDPQEEGMEHTPVFLPGEFHGQKRLAGYSPWGRKESDMTE